MTNPDLEALKREIRGRLEKIVPGARNVILTPEESEFLRQAPEDIRRLLDAVEELERELDSWRNQCGMAHEFLDALRVPEQEADVETGEPKSLNLVERIAFTTMEDDWDEPSDLVREILSRSSEPSYHNERVAQAEAELAQERQKVAALRSAIEETDRKLEKITDNEDWIREYRIQTGPWHRLLALSRGMQAQPTEPTEQAVEK